MSRILLFLCLWPVALWADSSVLPLRPAFNAEQRSWLQAHDELRVGLIMQAPWAQFDRRQQRLSGANVELMSRLLQGMGVKPQWLRFTDQDELEAALQRGEALAHAGNAIAFAPAVVHATVVFDGHVQQRALTMQGHIERVRVGVFREVGTFGWVPAEDLVPLPRPVPMPPPSTKRGVMAQSGAAMRARTSASLRMRASCCARAAIPKVLYGWRGTCFSTNMPRIVSFTFCRVPCHAFFRHQT